MSEIKAQSFDWKAFWTAVLRVIMNLAMKGYTSVKSKFVKPKLTAKQMMKPGHLPKDHPYYFPTREEWLAQQNEKNS